MQMRRQWQWFVLAALVLSGCAGSAQVPVGSVESVLSPVALVNNSPAGAGDDIPSGATLSTNNSGVLEFRLQSVLVTCQLRPESHIVIQPSQGAAMHYERGAVWCQASAAPQQELVIDVGVRQLHVKQARFGLRDGQAVIERGEAVIKDDDGAALEVVDEGEACDMNSPQVPCTTYTPTAEELDYLGSVETSHQEDLQRSDPSAPTESPETDVRPSETDVTPPETDVIPPETDVPPS